MRPLRIAVWGLGRHAVTKILPAIFAVDGLELYGVCSRNLNSVTTSANKWDCMAWVDPTSMLSDPKVDIVYVATPIALHHEHGKQVLESNKHFWCEKPLTCKLQDTLQLLNSAGKKGLSVCEGQMFLYHAQYQKLIHYIESFQLGNIISLDCKFGIPRLENNSFRTNSSLGGGAFFDVGCYPVAAILGLFTNSETHLTYANISMPAYSTVDTTGQAIITFSNGVIANLEWRINSSYRNEISIWGEKGSVFTEQIFSKASDYTPIFYLKNMQGVESAESGLAEDHFQLMFQRFLSIIYDPALAELERKSIIRRAILMDQIWSLGKI